MSHLLYLGFMLVISEKVSIYFKFTHECQTIKSIVRDLIELV